MSHNPQFLVVFAFLEKTCTRSRFLSLSLLLEESIERKKYSVALGLGEGK